MGIPPHLRKRFQISQEKAAVCSSRKSRWNSSQKYHVALPLLRFWVTRPQIWSWTMSIPIFFSCLPSSLTVSYTHLDVYKRQVLSCRKHNFLIKENLLHCFNALDHRMSFAISYRENGVSCQYEEKRYKIYAYF